MEMVQAALILLAASAFAYCGIAYTEKYFNEDWRPGSPLHGPRMVSRSQATEDQPGWSAYAASLPDRSDD